MIVMRTPCFLLLACRGLGEECQRHWLQFINHVRVEAGTVEDGGLTRPRKSRHSHSKVCLTTLILCINRQVCFAKENYSNMCMWHLTHVHDVVWQLACFSCWLLLARMLA